MSIGFDPGGAGAGPEEDPYKQPQTTTDVGYSDGSGGQPYDPNIHGEALPASEVGAYEGAAQQSAQAQYTDEWGGNDPGQAAPYDPGYDNSQDSWNGGYGGPQPQDDWSNFDTSYVAQDQPQYSQDDFAASQPQQSWQDFSGVTDEWGGGRDPGQSPGLATSQAYDTDQWQNPARIYDQALDGGGFFGIAPHIQTPQGQVDWDPGARNQTQLVNPQGEGLLGGDPYGQQSYYSQVEAAAPEIRNNLYTALAQPGAEQAYNQAFGAQQARGDYFNQQAIRTAHLQMVQQEDDNSWDQDPYSSNFNIQQGLQDQSRQGQAWQDYQPHYQQAQQAQGAYSDQWHQAQDDAASQFDYFYGLIQQGYGFDEATRQAHLSQAELLNLWSAGQSNDPVHVSQIRQQWIAAHAGDPQRPQLQYDQRFQGQGLDFEGGVNQALGLMNVPIDLVDRAFAGVTRGGSQAGAQQLYQVVSRFFTGQDADTSQIHGPFMALMQAGGVGAHQAAAIFVGLQDYEDNGVSLLDEFAATGESPTQILAYLRDQGEYHMQQDRLLGFVADNAANALLGELALHGAGAARGALDRPAAIPDTPVRPGPLRPDQIRSSTVTVGGDHAPAPGLAGEPRPGVPAGAPEPAFPGAAGPGPADGGAGGRPVAGPVPDAPGAVPALARPLAGLDRPFDPVAYAADTSGLPFGPDWEPSALPARPADAPGAPQSVSGRPPEYAPSGSFRDRGARPVDPQGRPTNIGEGPRPVGGGDNFRPVDPRGVADVPDARRYEGQLRVGSPNAAAHIGNVDRPANAPFESVGSRQGVDTHVGPDPRLPASQRQGARVDYAARAGDDYAGIASAQPENPWVLEQQDKAAVLVNRRESAPSYFHPDLNVPASFEELQALPPRERHQAFETAYQDVRAKLEGYGPKVAENVQRLQKLEVWAPPDAEGKFTLVGGESKRLQDAMKGVKGPGYTKLKQQLAAVNQEIKVLKGHLNKDTRGEYKQLVRDLDTLDYYHQRSNPDPTEARFANEVPDVWTQAWDAAGNEPYTPGHPLGDLVDNPLDDPVGKRQHGQVRSGQVAVADEVRRGLDDQANYDFALTPEERAQQAREAGHEAQQAFDIGERGDGARSYRAGDPIPESGRNPNVPDGGVTDRSGLPPGPTMREAGSPPYRMTAKEAGAFSELHQGRHEGPGAAQEPAAYFARDRAIGEQIKAVVEKAKSSGVAAAKENAMMGLATLNPATLAVNDDDSDTTKFFKRAAAIIGVVGGGYAIARKTGVTSRIAARAGKGELPGLDFVSGKPGVLPKDTRRYRVVGATRGYLESQITPWFEELNAGKIGIDDITRRTENLIDGTGRNAPTATRRGDLVQQQIDNLWAVKGRGGSTLGEDLKGQLRGAIGNSNGIAIKYIDNMLGSIDTLLAQDERIGRTYGRDDKGNVTWASPGEKVMAGVKAPLADTILLHNPAFAAEQWLDARGHTLLQALDQIGKEQRRGAAGITQAFMDDPHSGWSQDPYLRDSSSKGLWTAEPSPIGKTPVAGHIRDFVETSETKGKQRQFAQQASSYLNTGMARELGTGHTSNTILQWLEPANDPFAGQPKGRLEWAQGVNLKGENLAAELDGTVHRGEFADVLDRYQQAGAITAAQAKEAQGIFDAHQADANHYGLSEVKSHMRDYQDKTNLDMALGQVMPFHYWTTHNLPFVARFAAKHPAAAIAFTAAAAYTMDQNKDLPNYAKMSIRVPARHVAQWLPAKEREMVTDGLDLAFGKGQDPRLNLWGYVNPFVADIAKVIDHKDLQALKNAWGSSKTPGQISQLATAFGYHEGPQFDIFGAMAQRAGGMPAWLDGLTQEPYQGRSWLGVPGNVASALAELTPLAGITHGVNRALTGQDYSGLDEQGLKGAPSARGYWTQRLIQQGLYAAGVKNVGTDDRFGQTPGPKRAAAPVDNPNGLPASAIPKVGGGQLPLNYRQQAFFAQYGLPKGNPDDPNDPWKKSPEGVAYWDRYGRQVNGDESRQSVLPNHDPALLQQKFRKDQIDQELGDPPPTSGEPGYNAAYSQSWYNARDRRYEAAGIPVPEAKFAPRAGAPSGLGLAQAVGGKAAGTNVADRLWGIQEQIDKDMGDPPPKSGEPGYSSAYSQSWYQARDQWYAAAGLPVPSSNVPVAPGKPSGLGQGAAFGAQQAGANINQAVNAAMSAIMDHYESLKDPQTGKGTAASNAYYNAPLSPGGPSPAQFVARWSANGATKGSGLEHPNVPARGYGVGYDQPGGAPSSAPAAPSKTGATSTGRVASPSTPARATSTYIPNKYPSSTASKSGSTSSAPRPSTVPSKSASASDWSSFLARYGKGTANPASPTSRPAPASPVEPGLSAKDVATRYNDWDTREKAGKADFGEAASLILQHEKSGGDPAPYLRRLKFTTYAAITNYSGDTRQAGDKQRGAWRAAVKALPDTTRSLKALQAIYDAAKKRAAKQAA